MPRNSTCTACLLSADARTTCVWGRWNGEHNPLMVVGEAPGQVEDAQGLPFVGPSGKLLAEALEKSGVHNYYLTNAVKCTRRGPPSSTELKACHPYLEEEIRDLQPKFILALGATSVHRFMKGKITEIAGKETWSDKYGCWVFPALHPAAILRDPNREHGWRADIARFGRLVRGELVEKPPVDTRLILSRDDLGYLLEMLETRPFTYDFETPVPPSYGFITNTKDNPGTKDLPWWHKLWKPLTIAFGFRDTFGELRGWTVPLAYPDSGVDVDALKWFLGEMIPLMSDPSKPKSPHNGIFDDLCWYRLTGQLPFMTCDTMVLAHVLDENRLKALKYLGRALLGWPQWDVDSTKEHPLDKLAEYNAYDAAGTLALREYLLPQLQAQPSLCAYFTQVEMPKVRAVERMIAYGIHVDQEVLCRLTASTTSQRTQIQTALPIENPASTPQLRMWLYETLKLAPPHVTPKGNPSTDEEAIKRLVQRNPQHAGIRTLLDWRHQNKLLTTYLTPVSTSLDNSFDGRMHYEFRSTSVETGRLGSPFHTIPREAPIRSMYTAPSGWTFVSADLAQIEARIAAWAAAGKPSRVATGGSSMLAAWFTHRDVYVETAATILNKRPDQVTRNPEDPNNERQVMGKVPVLASLYDISPKGIQEYAWKEFEIDWTDAQARRVWDGFHRSWPEFKRWHELMRVKITTDGFVRSEIGRIRRLPAAQYGDYKAIAEAVRAGINAPIQSIASDIQKTALILLNQHLEFGRRFHVVGEVHDSLECEVRDDYVDEFLPLLKFVMESAHLALRPLGLHLPHGLVRTEVYVGNWGYGKEVKNIPAYAGAWR